MGYKTYRKKYNKKYSRYYKKKPTASKKQRYENMAYKGYRMGLKAMRYLNTEFKYHDKIADAITADFNGNIDLLNQISQGDTDQTRDGDSLKMMSLTMRASILTETPVPVRCIIFYDHQDNVNNVDDFLQYVGDPNIINSPKNHDTRFRSKTLYDQTYSFTPGGREQYSFRKQIDLGLRTQFNNGTVNINSGSLKIIWAAATSAPAVLPVINYVARITFVDN